MLGGVICVVSVARLADATSGKTHVFAARRLRSWLEHLRLRCLLPAHELVNLRCGSLTDDYTAAHFACGVANELGRLL